MIRAPREAARPPPTVVTLRIVIVDPPAGVTWALQTGRSALEGPSSATRTQICFTTAVRVASSSLRAPPFRSWELDGSSREVSSAVTDQGIVVLGIPIPSSSPVFLSIVAMHVLAGLICTIAGVVAVLAPKRRGRHPAAGTTYYWSLVVVFVSMAALSVLRWPANNHLFTLGIFSFGAAIVGRMARRRAGAGWLRVHVTGMGVSYVLGAYPTSAAFSDPSRVE